MRAMRILLCPDVVDDGRVGNEPDQGREPHQKLKTNHAYHKTIVISNHHDGKLNVSRVSHNEISK